MMKVVAETIPSRTIWQQLEYILPRFFLLLLVFVSLFGARSAELKTFSLIFISILFEALPFMLLGSLAGGFIEEFIPREKLTAMMPSGSFKAVLIAAGVGFVFPVCECAIVPVVRRLLRKGVPFSAAIAYLLAGPIVNPLVGLSTAVAYFFNWKMVALRLGLGYIAAVTIGLIVNRLVAKNERLADENNAGQTTCCSCGHEHDHTASDKSQNVQENACQHHVRHENFEHEHSNHFTARIHRAMLHGAGDFLEVACFLVAGAFFAAAAQTFVDRQLIMELMAENWLAVMIMMFLAVALNLCSEADAFVGASFRHIVGVPGQLGFLVLGPMFDIKLFFMYFSIFSRKTAITLAITTISVVYLLVMLSSFFIDIGPV